MSLPVPAGMQPILQATIVLSPTSPQRVLITDDIEGDMTFTFQLCTDVTDRESYTKLNIIDDFHAEIQIYNAPAQESISPSQLINSGTYKRENALFMNYMLDKIEADGNRRCVVLFYIKPMSENTLYLDEENEQS